MPAGGLLCTTLVLAAIADQGESPTADADPIHSVVSTTAADHGWAVNYPKQRKLFVMAGRLWVFYSDGENGVYRTSRDGRRWSEPATFAPGGHYGHRFGCWFDGTYLHYCLCTAALGADVFYRRGEPNRDGTITWSAEPQIAFDTPADENVMYPKVIVDSAGHPWVTFLQLVYQVPNTPPYDAVVVKSSADDGTWKTAEGFPFHLVNHKPVAGYPDPVGAPLTDEKTFWIYNDRVGDDDVYAARVWNGEDWEDEEIVARPASEYSFFDVVADGDDVHVIHGAGTIRYQKRTWGSGWGEPFPVDDSASGHTSLTLTGPNGVVVTWIDMTSQSVRYRQMTDGRWGPAVSWVDASDEGLAGTGINLNGLVRSAGRLEHAVIYTTGSSSPFEVRFAARARSLK